MGRRVVKAVDVLVIGGGPAGIAAAVATAGAALSTVLIEQRPTIGGALFMQPAAGSAPVPMPPSPSAHWKALAATLATLPVDLRLQHGFGGVDATGTAIIEDRKTGRMTPLRPRGIVLAVGALEAVTPRPGWDLPQVVTIGGLQMMMKQSGCLPPGRVVLAGSGPLLIAAAAQMAALGHRPLAVLEAGRPMRAVSAGAALAFHPDYVAQAGFFGLRLALHRVAWRTRRRVVAIERDGGALALTVDGPDGLSTLSTDWVALHDGLRPNDFGLPEDGDRSGPIVMRAGDCREVLGGMAAISDGTRTGARMVAALAGRPAPGDGTSSIDRHRRAQSILGRIFAPPPVDLAALPDATVLCRCENRTVGDLRALLGEHHGVLSPREVKLNGRFAMGSCQGRFCAEWTARLLAANGGPVPDRREITGHRWPTRPLPVSSFVAGETRQAVPVEIDE